MVTNTSVEIKTLGQHVKVGLIYFDLTFFQLSSGNFLVLREVHGRVCWIG
jgi:hypothetical protein